jgi:hypothetical protein
VSSPSRPSLAALRGALRDALGQTRAGIRSLRLHAIGAAIVAFALMMILSVAPPPAATDAEQLQVYVDSHAQTLEVDPNVQANPEIDLGDYTATPGVQTLAASGTNYDWAKLVLIFADLPVTDANVTVFTRWMRQENGADDWWNRNNPLNNGWGSGGGGGTGTYPNLIVAAQNAAEAMRTLAGYQGFVAAFERSAPTEEIESAIWNSNWASGHYAYGGHWHYTPVDVVTAPAGAWG